MIITALRDESGKLVGYARRRDLTQWRCHEEARRRSEERMRLLSEGVAEYALLMLDLDDTSRRGTSARSG